jgi:hypothetical protein
MISLRRSCNIFADIVRLSRSSHVSAKKVMSFQRRSCLCSKGLAIKSHVMSFQRSCSDMTL